ncbi:hypothetical protein QYZ87_03785 [Porphyromonadaceae bacterium W3.11]|nr:hypothetical protein [Porphyromonadaceae bacterium W3.11]MDN4753652.1 hypothetical protein [Porphyromonadaceae bacterium W3.11]
MEYYQEATYRKDNNMENMIGTCGLLPQEEQELWDNKLEKQGLKEIPANLEEHLLEELQNIKSLCDEAIREINTAGITSRVSDILAEEVPEKSEGLFDLIVYRGRKSNSELYIATEDKIKQRTL